MKTVWTCFQRYSTRFGKDNARSFPYAREQEGNRSSDLRDRTKIKDAIDHVKKSKIKWAKHVMQYSDGRWSTAVTDRTLQDVKRTQGRSLIHTSSSEQEECFAPCPSSEYDLLDWIWLTTGTNGDVAGARSSKSMINGM
ncbi:hypothetical protein V3C99_001158 [Haemonchus contortus]|uniref:Transposase n=1 Tax=Haemonchus contortus TaxID=6289 RepID=A0A7I4YCG5_HAECO